MVARSIRFSVLLRTTRRPIPRTRRIHAAPTVSQDDLNRLLAREKNQGGRSAVKKLLGDLGFDTPEALGAFITTKREADQAALSEVERREQAAAQLERQASQRLADAEARERAAVRRAVLAGLGASGEDLADAVVLVERALADQPEADEAAVTAVAERLKERRPSLFGQQTPPCGARRFARWGPAEPWGTAVATGRRRSGDGPPPRLRHRLTCPAASHSYRRASRTRGPRPVLPWTTPPPWCAPAPLRVPRKDRM